MKHFKTTSPDGPHMEWVEDDNGKRTPIRVSMGALPKRRFADPNAKIPTPWELRQMKQWLLKFVADTKPKGGHQ